MSHPHPAGPLAGMPAGALEGVRVVEICSTFAGPACARLLADFGADVIKLEPREGDPVRQLGDFADGVSLQGVSLMRGKRIIALDLKHPEGRAIAHDLIRKADILVENNRPGVMERLGFGYEELSRDNPGLVMVRISGYGQDGPNAQRPGYGAICEAFGGVRYLTGDPDRPPSRVALATTDYLTAVYAAFGAMMALFVRQRTGKGQVVDAALYETAFSMMEGLVPAYQKLGKVPFRNGPNLQAFAPNSLYPTADDSYVLIAANNKATYERLVAVMRQPHMLTDPRFATLRARAENMAAVDAEVTNWTRQHTGAGLEAMLNEAGVPVARVYSMADIFRDPHYKARDMLLDVPHPVLGTTVQTGIVPKLSATPGRVRHAGHETGADTEAILRDELGYDAARVAALLADGAVGALAGG
ncbi:MAG: CoA transferase [Pigmentiphaga sp.]|nr:CoA transferase [Pigmentiphaga sp.]